MIRPSHGYGGQAGGQDADERGLGASRVLDTEGGEFAEFGVEGEDLTFRALVGGLGEGGVHEAEAGSALCGKGVERFEEEVRAGLEFQFLGFQEDPTDSDGGG